MVAIFLAPLYLLLCLYLLFRIKNWMEACGCPLEKKGSRILPGILYAFLTFSIPVGFFLPKGRGKRFMKLVSDYWMGILLYLSQVVLLADGIRLLICLIKRKNVFSPGSEKKMALTGSACGIAIFGISTWGLINARKLRITPYEIKVEKKAGNLSSMKMVLVADLHLGYHIGPKQMKTMVGKINSQSPDLVVIAGDIFDNEYQALDCPEKLIRIFRGIKSKYGVYACYGNHDVEEEVLAGFTFGGKTGKTSSREMDDFLKKAHIRLLKDETVLVDDSFYLCGRADATRPGNATESRLSPKELTKDLDLTKPVILLDHQPGQLGELAEAGVDVDLCGHTHGGQLFPGNLITGMKWKNSYGYLKKGRMHNIVTSGVGIFGPGMRVGTRAEICPVTIHFHR